MKRAGVGFDKALQSAYAAQYGVHPAVALGGWHPGVVRMAGHAYFVFLRHGNDAIEKVSDALPVRIFADRSGLREWRILPSIVINKSAVPAAATAARGLRANHTENVQVVFEGRNTRLGGVANHLADAIDLAVPLGTLAQQDARVFISRNVMRAHGQRNHVQLDPVRLDTLPQAYQAFFGPMLIELGGRKTAADMLHSQGS